MPLDPTPVPTGPEFRANVTTAGHQGGPAVAAFADGGFVMAWAGQAADGTFDVFAQRFAAGGAAVGGEFRVNALTAGDQFAGDVAALADGGFVVSWAGAGADGTSDAFARRFAADGSAAGAEFRVDAAAAGHQGAPAVAALAGGGFVASWVGTGADGTLDVFARRFAADGSAAGAEFRPGPGAAGTQYQPSVAALADGGFAVSWKDDLGIFAQRFATDGTAASAEFRVNTTDSRFTSSPEVAALADGGFVVSWQGAYGYRNAEVFARRFAADGSAAGGDFRVQDSPGMNWQPAVTGLADGGFVVSWVNSEPVGSAGLIDKDIVARRYAADGAAAGGEFRVTATSGETPGAPSVAALPGGGFVVAWTGAGAAGDRDVLARAFSVPGGDGGPPDAPVVRGTAGDDVLARAPGAGVVYDGLGGRDALDMGHLGFRGAAVAARADGDTSLARGADACVLRGVEEARFADGRLVFDADDPAAKVLRLYEAALDRLPDQGGLNHWIDALRHGQPLADLARAFLGSAESQARSGAAADADDAAFVDRLYQNVLGRAGDAEGRASWLGRLDAGAATRAEVLAAFSEGAENKAGTAPLVAGGIWDRSEAAMEVARLYDSMLGRRPDAEGLTHWKAALEDGHATLARVADAFAAGAEFRAGYGALDGRGFVEALYGNALDRPADQKGLDFWTARLDAGASRAEVALAFSECAEHAALTAPSIGGEDPAQFGILFA